MYRASTKTARRKTTQSGNFNAASLHVSTCSSTQNGQKRRFSCSHSGEWSAESRPVYHYVFIQRLRSSRPTEPPSEPLICHFRARRPGDRLGTALLSPASARLGRKTKARVESAERPWVSDSLSFWLTTSILRPTGPKKHHTPLARSV